MTSPVENIPAALNAACTRKMCLLISVTDYKVSIPPGGKTDALVETVISWNHNGQILHTRGLDADQTEAAIKATIKMLNLIKE